MSIEKIDEIPLSLNGKRKCYRHMIRNDIEKSILNRVEKFELVGDYNYKYLNKYAYEEIEKYFRINIFHPIAQRVREELKKKLDLDYIFVPSSYEEVRNFATVYRVTKEDRIHVYVQYNFEFMDHLYEYLLDKTEKRWIESEERKKRRNERKDEG